MDTQKADVVETPIPSGDNKDSHCSDHDRESKNAISHLTSLITSDERALIPVVVERLRKLESWPDEFRGQWEALLQDRRPALFNGDVKATGTSVLCCAIHSISFRGAAGVYLKAEFLAMILGCVGYMRSSWNRSDNDDSKSAKVIFCSSTHFRSRSKKENNKMLVLLFCLARQWT